MTPPLQRKKSLSECADVERLVLRSYKLLIFNNLYVESEMHDIAILDHVFLTLNRQPACLTAACL